MAYAIKYLFKFESSNGTTREIRVLQDGYTGEVIQRPLGRAPILKKQQNGPVHGTSLEFYAECNVDREFIEFYTSDPKAYRVDLYAGATLLWQGYITPELYSEPDIAPPYDVRVVATDGVGELKLYDYAAQGTVTLRALLSGLLARTGLGTDIYLISSLKAGSRGAGALLDMTINLDYMAGESCYDVLTYLLDTLHATITWWKGAWILTRETNVTFTSGKVRYFNTAGNSALLADSVQTLGSLRANPAWPVGQLSTVIDPAKNRVTVQAPWHVVTCLRNSDMGSDADWTKAKNARYETDGYVLPININTGTSETAVISQATSMAGLRVPMSLSVKATGATSEISAQVTGAVLGVLLTYKVGNVTYHLVKGDDGVPVWQQGSDIGTYIPLRTRIDFQQQLATWGSSRIEAEELSIDNIPPFLQGMTFPAGTLTVYILGYCAKIYGAYLDVVLPKGYQDILRIDNGARGEGSEVEIAIGRETADNAYYAAFLQGLLLDSGNLITSFSDANFSGGMDYLAFIARDYALSVALPRAKVTGTVYLESSIAAPPLVFTKGALNYWLQTWSWNLYEDELEIEGLTLPSASLTVESETILESTASASSSTGRTSGGGAPISPGTSMAAVQEWVNSQGYLASVEAASIYATITALNGVSSRVTTLEGRTNWDTYFGVDENGDVYVKKNGNTARNFYSWGAVSAGGLSSGGGSEGASLAAVWASLKTNSDDYANEKINAYHIPIGTGLDIQNGLIVATNSGTVTGVSLASGTNNGTLHLVVNGTAQSDVAVTGLGSMAYASSGDYVPIATAKTITAVHTFSNGLKLTTAKSWSNIDRALYFGYPEDDARLSYYNVNSSTGLTYNPATGALKAGSFVKRGGTSSQFLKADGSVDSSTYLTGITSTMVTNALGYTPWHASNHPTTLGGYGITDAVEFNQDILDLGATHKMGYGYTAHGWPYSGPAMTFGSGKYTAQIQSSASGNHLYYRQTVNGTAQSWVEIYHSGNANLSTVNWEANQMTAQSFKLASGAPTLTWDSSANAWHLSGNFYADGWISADGVSSGGGASGIDLAAMWASLTNSISDAYAATKIAAAHIPDMSSTYGYLKAGDISGVYLPLNVGAGKTITSTSNIPLIINNTTTSNEVGFRYQLGGENKAFFGYNASSTYGTYMYSYAGPYYLGITDAGVAHFNGNALLHAGNYTSYVNTTNFPGLMGNQTITLSGDVSGSGATSISVSIGQGKVTNAMLAGSIANSKLSNSSITINGSSTSLGGSFSTASITAGTAGQSGASTGVSFSIPYVTMNKYGIVTAYGTHTHTISASDLTTTIGSTTYAPYNSAGYLPLSAGSSYPLTGALFIALGQGIQSPGSSYSMIFQDSSATYVGQPDSMTIIRSSNNNLVHRKVSTDYAVWDASNSNKSDVAWTCSTLTASGNISTSGYVSVGTGGANSYVGSDAANNIFLHNSSGYILVVDGVNVRRGASATTATLGNSTYPWAGITATSADFRLTNSTDFHIYRNNSGGSAGITYYSAAQTTNYWNVGMDPTGGTYGGRFYWYYTGSYLAYLTTTGNFVATGAITAGAASDARLKTNIQSLSAESAKRIVMALNPVTFTWNEKAGELYNQYKGDDLGMIAQEVEPYLPQAVGTIFEKYKRLDYTKVVSPLVKVAQDHESRIRQLEAKVAELEMENERLRS